MDTRYPEGSVREQANVRDVRATVKQRCDCGTVTETALEAVSTHGVWTKGKTNLSVSRAIP